MGTTMASPMSISCLRVPAMSVNAMQGVLRKNGVAPSPMEKFALTSFAATRDPSMKAQAREEFSKLDVDTQAKLKSLGMLVADKFHPIFDNWNEGPFVSSMQSHFSETAVKNFWPAFWIMTAGHELATTFADYDGKEGFDYGFDPLNLRPEDPEKQKEYKTMELNHGRWAMFCAAGIIAQELVTGKSVI